MNTNRDLNYRLFIQKENNFIRTDIHTEYQRYATIRSGDVDRVRENFDNIKANFDDGKGVLSDDPVRNNIYHLVVAGALIARFCVEAGMEQDVAYTLTDIYIRKADKCKKSEDVIDLLGEMQIDFATRMRDLRKSNAISIHVRRTIDHIYNHLHELITLKDLAERENITPSYLAKLFLKETGFTVKGYITQAKIATAKNMLKYSDFSISEIALALGFCTQSAFTSVFRKNTGFTPAKYRDIHYSDSIGSDMKSMK